MLGAPGGARSAWAFTGAWALSLGAVSTAVLVVSDDADANVGGTPASWVSIVKLVVALLLALFSVRQWRGRNGNDEGAEVPGWIRKFEGLAPAKAAWLGVVLTALKPKNLLLTIGAGLGVAQVGARPGGQAIALAVFVVLGSAGLVAPLGCAWRCRAGVRSC
jgi:hypothetical protein